MNDQVASLLAEFSPAFEASGAMLRVAARSANRLQLEIVLTPQACRDCIMPADVVAQVVAANIRERLGVELSVEARIIPSRPPATPAGET
jgi:hypothetical protein